MENNSKSKTDKSEYSETRQDNTVIQVINITTENKSTFTNCTENATRIMSSECTRIAPVDTAKSLPEETVLAHTVLTKNPGQGTPVIGDTIKQRFVLMEVLGVGGMGKVFKALDLRKQEAHDKQPYVAVKVLNDEFRAHPEALIALQREARKSQSLAHPNIVNVHDFDREGERVFMTMELLQGRSLDKIIADDYPTGMPMELAQNIINNICQALIYAHKHKIIHADLKPANIFITETNTAKIFDFGIARACQSSQLEADLDNNDKTLFDPTALGALTPTYASLEMLQGQAPRESDDLYSICCVFYELLTGKHPYNRKSAQQALELALSIKKIKKLDKHQARAIYKGLSFNRSERFRDVQTFINAYNYKSRPIYWYLSFAFIIILIVTSLLLPRYTQWYQQYRHQDFFLLVNESSNSTLAGLKQKTDDIDKYINLLDMQSKHFVLNRIKDSYIHLVKQQVKFLLDKGDVRNRYEQAYTIVDKLGQFYPDSATLDKLIKQIDSHKYNKLNQLNNQFNELLENAQYHHFVEPQERRQLSHLLSEIKSIDFEHSLLKDERLLLIFQDGINQAIKTRDIDVAETLLTFAVSIFPDHLVLKNLRDKLNLQKKSAMEPLQVVSSGNGHLNAANINELKETLGKLIVLNRIDEQTNAEIMLILKQLDKYLGTASLWLKEKKQTLSKLYLDHSNTMREQGRLVESRRYLEQARILNPSIYGIRDEEAILSALEKIQQVRHKAKQRLAKINGLKTTLQAQIKAQQMQDALRTFASLKRILGRNDPYVSGVATEKMTQSFYLLAQQQFKAQQYQAAAKTIKKGLGINRQHSGLRGLLKKNNRQLVLLEKARMLNQVKNPDTLKHHVPTSSPTADITEKKIKSNMMSETRTDTCRSRLAGYGKRRRAQCFDRIDSINKAPLMVVIPQAENDQPVFAMSRYEITEKQYALFCKMSGQCSGKDSDSVLPVTSISFKQARNYVQWLSRVTGYEYSIPTKQQWEFAVSANNTYKPVDLNCRIQFGSKLLKGRNLLAANSGESNPWGLLNALGNAREFVQNGSTIMAMGGAYTDPLKKCNVSNGVANIKQGDSLTGFRIVRAVQL